MVSDRRPQTPASIRNDREQYRRVFRKRVFQLMNWGYSRLAHSEYQTVDEEEITGDLVAEIRKVLEDRSSPRWVGRFEVSEDPRVAVPERRGKKRKRVDIEFVQVRYGPRPRYPFEAKRLSANTHATLGKYFGPDGLGEYLRGDYGRDLDEAGMLGYVQSHTIDYWAKKAGNSLSAAQKRHHVDPDCCWVLDRIIPELGACYLSRHDRLGGQSPLLITHCFLAFI